MAGGFLYDGEDMTSLGGGGLYDGVDVPETVPDTLLYRDLIVVELTSFEQTPYGTRVTPTGEVFGCYCSVEGRTQKNSVFSDNWAQDDTPTSTGGLREVNMVKVLAPEWHGDIYTRFWTADGSCWQVDGSPVDMPHSTDVARHWEMQARRVYAPELARNRIDPPAIPEGSRVWGT